MPAEVIMPALGMAQDTGTVLRWLKFEGDQVAAGEALIEVETDKATVELEAPIAGTLAGVSAADGDEVPIGQVIAFVLAAGESLPPTGADPKLGVPQAPPVAAPPAAPTAEPSARRRLASPKARRIAAEMALDVAQIEGSGPNGAVVAADVERHRPVASPSAERLPVGGAWRIMAERTTQSWQQVPHFFLHRQVDASALVRWREVSRSEISGVSHTDLLVKIVAEALRRHPHVNATCPDGQPHQEARINIGIAVATDAALVVPVIHDAADLTLEAISARRAEIVAAAREGRLRPTDLADGTFTISNLGMFGIDSFDAIVNAPQVAILAVGRIADRVVPVDGAPAVRPVMELSVSFDHRAVDGARGAAFVQTLSRLAEEPLGLVR